MGVGDPQDFQQPLDRAVLAHAPMERVEHHIRRDGLQDGGDIGLHVDGSDLVALLLQAPCSRPGP